MPNFVQLYRSTDLNSPVLTGQQGTGLAWLQACLVDGFTPASLSSITIAGSVATATLAVANSTLLTGNYAKIAGATGAFTALNASQGPINVLSSTSFTFAVAGGFGSPVTGTLTYAKAPLGWTNAFPTVSFVGAFRGQSVTGRTAQHYLRVDDNGPNATPSYLEMCARGYVAMSDLNTGTELFPTLAQHAAPGRVWRKAAAVNATARPWYLWGDGATFYFLINSDNSLVAGRALCGFGGHLTDTAGDAYNSFIAGSTSSNLSNPNAGLAGMCSITNLSGSTTWNNVYCPRSYTQLGTSLACGGVQGTGTQASPAHISQKSGAPFAYPHPVDGGLYVGPILIAQDGLALRGRFPGLYHHMHQTDPGVEGDQVVPVNGLSGVTLRCAVTCCQGSAGMVLFDEFGPW